MQDELRAYLRVLILVLPLSMLFRIFSTLSQSLGKPRLVTWIQVGALAPKVLLSTWLVHGGLGLAPLGVQGCAWATLAVNGAADGSVASALAAWRDIKAAANAAVITHGGTITHHHAVGRDHRSGYEREADPLFRRVLAAAKRELDPQAVLNPGVLFDPLGRSVGITGALAPSQRPRQPVL